MPMRDMFKNSALKTAYDNGTLDLNKLPGFKAPQHMPIPPRPPTAPEKLESTEYVSGQGMGTLRVAGDGGGRPFVFKSGTWRPASRMGRDTMAARTYDMVFDKAKQESQQSTGVGTTGHTDDGRPSTAPELRPGTSGTSTARRPMTPADNGQYATALRQLETEKRVKNGYFRPGTGSRDPSLYKSFDPTRGNVLMVFNQMDEDLNGKVTFSELVSILIDLGCSEPQAEAIFRRLDTEGRGFIELKDWGTKDAAVAKVVRQLTTAYMRRNMGFPSQTSSPEKVERFSELFRAKEVTSLQQAVALARDYSFRKGVGLSSDGTSPMMSAFKFMDTDDSGQLDRDELMDGFFAIGVVLHPKLMDQIWSHFDKDGRGTVDFAEFIETLMPNINK